MNLPIDFTEQINALLGATEAEELIASLQKDTPVSIRFNPEKVTDSLCAVIRSSFSKVNWADCGYYLPERFTFTFDPLFHAGVYYVQEASSMFLEQAVRQTLKEPILALDLCAAPGGKTTHLRSLLPQGSLLVANEVIRSRSKILAENVTKWGNPDVMVTNNDPSDFSKTGVQFDLIVADVPCSGEGMFRKDPGAIDEWSIDNVEICHQRQRRIIADIWPNLRPDGILIYSTCTYNLRENEENIAWIIKELGAEPVDLEVSPEWNITGNLLNEDFPVYRFLPHKTPGEGFFMAVLRKTGTDESFAKPKKKKRKSDVSALQKEQEKAKTWVAAADQRAPQVKGSQLFVSSPYYIDEQVALSDSLNVLQTGLALGEIKGKDIIPTHALSMCTLLNRDAFVKVEVNYEQAIAYLRRDSLTLNLSPELPKGYLLLTYQDVFLGFVKNIGNRANNLYPQEWRILSGYLPKDLRTLGGDL